LFFNFRFFFKPVVQAIEISLIQMQKSF